jgi:hypothetical protein
MRFTASFSVMPFTLVSSSLMIRSPDFSRAHLQLAERLGVQEGRVRVEAGEHAVDGLGNEPLVVHRLDVVVLDPAEDFGKRAQILDRQGTRPLLRHGGEIEADQHTEDRAQNDQADLPKSAMHLCLLLCAQGVAPNQELTSMSPRAEGRRVFPDI